MCADAVQTQCGQSCEAGAWDELCVQQVESICGQGCEAEGWNESCVDMVGPVCGAACEQDPGCAHDKCYVGDKLNRDCDPCVAAICEVDSFCCDVSWDGICQAEVQSVCGLGCEPVGDCVPFQPGDSIPDEVCDQTELTVGVPCTGYLPVCNRGSADAPAGVIVYIYPGNSSHFPKCFPDLEHRVGSCIVPEAIPVGHCVDITEDNCEPYGHGGNVLVGNKTAMVNPPVGPAEGEINECFCQNNWSDYHSGGCVQEDIYHYDPMVYTQVYEADCPDGTEIQWGLFTYQADTPEDSNIVFEVHTGHCITDMGELVTATTARSFPEDTQSCSKLGPNPCPIDLYELLGEPDANKKVLELVITLNPNTKGSVPATLNNWEVTYSCADNI